MNIIKEQENRQNEQGASKNIKKEQGERPKIRREQGARDPPWRASMVVPVMKVRDWVCPSLRDRSGPPRQVHP